MLAAEQIYVQLREKRGSTYDRLTLADQLLKDVEWVALPTGGGGDLSSAYDRLEEDCFGDLVGDLGLASILEVLHYFPRRKDWEAHKYNFRRMWAEMRSAQRPLKTKPTPPISKAGKEYTPPHQFIDLSPGKARTEYGRVFHRAETLEEKCKRLEEENLKLREENKELRAVVDRAKRIFGPGIAS